MTKAKPRVRRTKLHDDYDDLVAQFNKVQAERAVQSVYGVRALRNHVVVSAPAHPPPGPPAVASDVADQCC